MPCKRHSCATAGSCTVNQHRLLVCCARLQSCLLSPTTCKRIAPSRQFSSPCGCDMFTTTLSATTGCCRLNSSRKQKACRFCNVAPYCGRAMVFSFREGLNTLGVRTGSRPCDGEGQPPSTFSRAAGRPPEACFRPTSGVSVS